MEYMQPLGTPLTFLVLLAVEHGKYTLHQATEYSGATQQQFPVENVG